MPAPVYCVAWSPDGKQVIGGSFDGSLKLWDATSGALVREFKAFKEKEFEKGHRDGVFSVAFSPDGKLIASGGNDRKIKLWTVADGQVVRDLINPNLKPATGAAVVPPQSHPGWINSLRFTPEGTHLVAVGEAPRFQGYLTVWQVADGKLLYAEQAAVGKYHALALSPNGRLLALACGPRGSQYADVNCFVIRMPELNKTQTTQASK
jgi:WD40 repeat protein